jgi:hypothetical protein
MYNGYTLNELLRIYTMFQEIALLAQSIADLHQHLLAMKEQDERDVAESHARGEQHWIGSLTCDMAHWIRDGITSVELLGDYLDNCCQDDPWDECEYWESLEDEQERELAKAVAEAELDADRLEAYKEANAAPVNNPFAALAA